MVVRLHPFTEFTRLFEDMDRVFRDNTDGGRSNPELRTWRPAIDLYDDGQQLVLYALMPGVSPDSVNLTIEQNILQLSGEFGYSLPDELRHQTTWYRREIGNGRFAQSIELPVAVDNDAIEASMEHGVLTLHMPKAAQARAKQIAINSPQAKALTE